jgi:hypothetical protein
MDDPSVIPAATVQDVDLSAAEPALAVEIRRLGDLMERGEETPEQFAELVRLLVRAGQRHKAEHLLRRNLEVIADGLALYRELFGTARPDEFAAAVEGFKEQFGVGLEFLSSRGFLDARYRVLSGPRQAQMVRQLGEPCEVQFDFADPDVVAADVVGQSDEEYRLLRWEDGRWRLPMG